MLNNLIRLIKVEHVDDLPVLWAQVQKVQIPTLLDEYFPTHGLWQGDLSFGEVAGVWLMLITSQGDHGLSPVQPWVAERLDTLTACVGKPIRPLDFSDDRWADLRTRPAERAVVRRHQVGTATCPQTKWTGRMRRSCGDSRPS